MSVAKAMAIFVGCAGWNLRKEFAADFPTNGTHLQRYSARLNAVEINSSFYRAHQTKTYQRWAATTPGDFRFAVKMPKQITHVSRLVDVEPQLERFVAEIGGLGKKLGPILVQLPPSLACKTSTAAQFFRAVRHRVETPIVCEPRHPTWFTREADVLLKDYAINRAAADPSVVPEAAKPGGSPDDCYFRWHGSPRMYYSAYEEQALAELASQILPSAKFARDVWCIFDNTAEGAALTNALALARLLGVALQAPGES